MFKLLKKLFSTRDGAHTVVVLNDDGSKPSSSHRLSPINLWLLCIAVLSGIAGIFIMLTFFTPLASYVYNQQEVRDSVISIQKKVADLQDTLATRNMQLRQIQQVMASGQDTSFANLPSIETPEKSSSRERNDRAPAPTEYVQRLPVNAVVISSLFQRPPEFPAPYPLEGTPTRLFNRSIGHYGTDIAAKQGSVFEAMADGVIINQEWTINYGYVVVVQHSNGIITVYKHAESTEKNIGDSVQQGDILGRIGDIGILSSGPHLHVEVWKNGIPQNPENYFIST